MPTSPAERKARSGHGRATLRDVAQAAGVTSITVSRYLREPARVAADTAERIAHALATTGYVPNKQAGLLASGRSNIVAALLPNLANSIFAETAQGLSDTLQAAGHELLIAATGYSFEREEEQLRALLGWHPAAIVVTGRRHSAGASRLLRQAQANGTPVIEIWDHHGRAGSGFTQVGFKHEDVGRAMASHLLRAGHRRIAYVDSGVAEDYRAHERGQAFAAAAQEAGAAVDVLVAPSGDAFDAGRHMLGGLLKGAQPAITAAAFANDHLACGALLEATRRGIAVPQRLAILGFGDFAIARQLQPALSSVQLPRYDIGAVAARNLLAALKGGQPVPSQTLGWTLVARGSTGPGQSATTKD
ncbi:MAG: LacI family DNA-binding transcriptional regulator [Rubrivivax sp.]|jgi:LacI family gluconate utilization system Gnt-I transcriptional repressor|nr:LacI family DNA-binding transcriptional regulator [Rubrivivax sp.]